MVPTDGSKPEWNLNGQVLDMTLSLRDPVSAIKAKIAEDTGMPPGKQKLRMETIFFKDSNRSGHDRNHFYQPLAAWSPEGWNSSLFSWDI